MPLYDFECSKCGHTFELFIKYQSSTEPACPNCGSGGDALQKLVPSSNFALKGGGWYKDGYGGK